MGIPQGKEEWLAFGKLALVGSLMVIVAIYAAIYWWPASGFLILFFLVFKGGYDVGY
jgi:hypothetical protein